MKKISAFVLAMAMVLSLGACAKTEPAPAPAPAPEASTSTPEAAPEAAPEEYEATGTLTLIAPYAAGGAVDLGGRLMAKYAAKYTDADIVVTNITGGGGTVGPAELLKYDADGTYMWCSNPSPTYVATPDKPLTFKFMEDFAFVSMMVQDQRVIAVPVDNGKYTTLEEFIDYAKANPGAIRIGCSGTGNSAYFTPYLLNQAAGIELNIIAFDGASEAKAAVLGGHIEAVSVSYSEVLPMVKENQVIVLGVAAAERFDKLPDVPTFLEKGYDVQMFTSRGFAMKAGTDPKIVEYWSDVIGKVAQDPEFLAEAESLGFPIKYLNAADFTKQCESEMAMYEKLIAEVG